MWFEGSVDAQDWNVDVFNSDDIALNPWPSTTPSWSASEAAASSGPTGQDGAGAYEVQAAATQDVRATFVDGNLSSMAIDTFARVDVAAAGCAEGDRLCVASGHARSEFTIAFEVVESSEISISGTLAAALGHPSPDDVHCELELYGINVQYPGAVFPCGTQDQNGAWSVAFVETLAAGRYALELTSLGTANAFSFRSPGFASVTTELLLEIDSGDTPEDVAFDWTVPDGFGFDEDGLPGVVDAYEPDGPLEIDRTFPVDFETSDAGTCDPDRTLTWLTDGSEATEPQAEFGSCTMTYEFAEEGIHEVTLEVRDADGELIGMHTEDVLVQDWLIVSIGDSVASGEGNPDLSSIGTTPETWQDQQCHRTAVAGPAQAAALIERADPKTSVTFVHLACSGATIASGLIGSYTGVEAGVALPPQLDDLVRFTGGREIDAITVSIGANDVHFSSIVEQCVKKPSCHLDQPGKAAWFFANKVVHLPDWYADLQAGFTGRGLDPTRVFITQYFDPTRTDSGAICPSGTILGDAPVVGPGSLQISDVEADWASNGMLVRLDQEVRGAATAHGWHFVDGIREAFLTHGYCAADSWIVRIADSFLYQGDKNGALHPNAPGHALYGSLIASDLTGQLYESGDLSKPRHPEP